MEFEYKDKDTLVQDAIDYIQSLSDDEVDFSDGEPLKTFLEAIMQELDYQYWQIEQTYNNSFIDTAVGDDLAELVKILGIEKKLATKATGQILFYRETPAEQNYIIPVGTLVETLPNIDGEAIQFETTIDSVLEIGKTEILVNIAAVTAGISGNVVSNKIIVLNNPPEGIESVTNSQAIIGGEDDEDDEVLRARAKAALDTTGNATVGAIKNKIDIIDGIRDVSILDMERGIGTVDILVLGDIVPLPDTKKTEINSVISGAKAAGVDAQLLEPTLISQDIQVTLTLVTGQSLTDTLRTKVIDSIKNYVDNLSIGSSLILNQLERYILNTDSIIVDVSTSNPVSNVTIQSREIIRTDNIIIS